MVHFAIRSMTVDLPAWKNCCEISYQQIISYILKLLATCSSCSMDHQMRRFGRSSSPEPSLVDVSCKLQGDVKNFPLVLVKPSCLLFQIRLVRHNNPSIVRDFHPLLLPLFEELRVKGREFRILIHLCKVLFLLMHDYLMKSFRKILKYLENVLCYICTKMFIRDI